MSEELRNIIRECDQELNFPLFKHARNFALFKDPRMMSPVLERRAEASIALNEPVEAAWALVHASKYSQDSSSKTRIVEKLIILLRENSTAAGVAKEYIRKETSYEVIAVFNHPIKFYFVLMGDGTRKTCIPKGKASRFIEGWKVPQAKSRRKKSRGIGRHGHPVYPDTGPG